MADHPITSRALPSRKVTVNADDLERLYDLVSSDDEGEPSSAMARDDTVKARPQRPALPTQLSFLSFHRHSRDNLSELSTSESSTSSESELDPLEDGPEKVRQELDALSITHSRESQHTTVDGSGDVRHFAETQPSADRSESGRPRPGNMVGVTSDVPLGDLSGENMMREHGTPLKVDRHQTQDTARADSLEEQNTPRANAQQTAHVAHSSDITNNTETSLNDTSDSAIHVSVQESYPSDTDTDGYMEQFWGTALKKEDQRRDDDLYHYSQQGFMPSFLGRRKSRRAISSATQPSTGSLTQVKSHLTDKSDSTVGGKSGGSRPSTPAKGSENRPVTPVISSESNLFHAKIAHQAHSVWKGYAAAPPIHAAEKDDKPSSKASRKITKALTEDGKPLRSVHLPYELIAHFLWIADRNTRNKTETCGILMAKLEKNEFRITHLFIPDQVGTPDYCSTNHEEEQLDFQIANDLVTVGWTCFLSSVDLHTQASYQSMLPEAIAIVCAPLKIPSIGLFRLTDPHGIRAIQECSDPHRFHLHSQKHIYTDVDLSSPGCHVKLIKPRIRSVNHQRPWRVKVIDYRR